MRPIAAVLLLLVVFSGSPAGAIYYPPPPPPPPIFNGGGTSGAAGASGVTGFIGFVAALVTYDLLRRTTCIGDPLRLGGPGFDSPVLPQHGNVMIPVHQRGLCGVPKAIRVRG